MSTVTDINIVDGDEGSDTLTGIERISFADVVMDIGALPGICVTVRYKLACRSTFVTSFVERRSSTGAAFRAFTE